VYNNNANIVGEFKIQSRVTIKFYLMLRRRDEEVNSEIMSVISIPCHQNKGQYHNIGRYQ
jgi:choline kinase